MLDTRAFPPPATVRALVKADVQASDFPPAEARPQVGKLGVRLQCGCSLEAKHGMNDVANERKKGVSQVAEGFGKLLPGLTETEPGDDFKIAREVRCDCLAFA